MASHLFDCGDSSTQAIPGERRERPVIRIDRKLPTGGQNGAFDLMGQVCAYSALMFAARVIGHHLSIPVFWMRRKHRKRLLRLE
jgi:hypothetical protein